MYRSLAIITCSILLAFGGCGHDAKRDNPFDPELTPAVEVQVALDDTAGTATLSWTPYAGEAPFEAYWVLRKPQRLEMVDTLTVIRQVDQTTFVDSTLAPDTFYSYRVSVVNEVGYETSSQPQAVRPLNLTPVQMRELRFDSATASASLSWTPYEGVRFRAYQILRRTVESAPQVVAEIEERNATSFLDTGLVGNTKYFYQVRLVNTRDEEVVSAEVSGDAFHRLVATWPLELDLVNYRNEPTWVRLYAEEDNRVTVLVAEEISDRHGEATRSAVSMFMFDSEGALLEERLLLERWFSNIEPRSVSTFVTPEGGRFLAFNSINPRSVSVLGFKPDGSYPLYPEQRLFVNAFSERLTGDQAIVAGEIALIENCSCYFDNLVVSSGGRVHFADDFEDGDLDGWDSVSSSTEVKDGKISATREIGVLAVVAQKADVTWQNLHLEVDVGINSRIGGLRLGSPDRTPSSSFTLLLGASSAFLSSGQVQLIWESNELERPRIFEERLEVVEQWSVQRTPYRLALEVVDGQVSASVRGPILTTVVLEDQPGWVHLTGSGETILLVADKEAHSFGLSGEKIAFSPRALQTPASEMRLWERPPSFPQAGRWLGVCLPEEHRVAFGPASVTSSGHLVILPSLQRGPSIGAGIGPQPGQFIIPLSFDVGPDQRMYVLDAGNARIQVFDFEGNYLTRWGRRGSGPGEFDFGSGQNVEDFAGSVAVDREGFIYVADVFNQRIQKFAP